MQLERAWMQLRELAASFVRVEAGDEEEERDRRLRMVCVVLVVSLGNLAWTGLYQWSAGYPFFAASMLFGVACIAGIAVALAKGHSVRALSHLVVLITYLFTFGTTLAVGAAWPGGVFFMALVPGMAILLTTRNTGLIWSAVTLASLFLAAAIDPLDGGGLLAAMPRENALGAIYRTAGLLTVGIAAAAYFYSALQEQSNLALRKTLERFRQGERRFQAMTENAYDLICEMDLDSRFTYLSPGFEEMAGIAPEAALGRHVRDFIHPEDWQIAVDHWKSMRDKGAARQAPIRFISPQGKVLWIEVTMREYLLAQGEPRIVAIARDVTERREREALLLHQQGLVAVGTMAAGAAHQLNNPIASIGAAAEFANLTRNDEAEFVRTAAEALDTIQVEARRCGSILRSMLAFAREEPCQQWEEAVDPVLERAVRAVQTEDRLTGAEFVLDLARGAPRVVMSPIEIEQVIINLIRNAVKAGSSRIVVRTRFVSLAAQLEIEVRDNGSGLDEHAKASAFSPFFTTRPASGSGLGLSVARKIIEEHGGQLALAETGPSGTAFRATLPLATLPDPESSLQN